MVVEYSYIHSYNMVEIFDTTPNLFINIYYFVLKAIGGQCLKYLWISKLSISGFMVV